MTASAEPVVVEQSFSVPPETVWNAITNREQMVEWFFSEIAEFEARVGFETQFNVRSGERDFHHRWKITEAVTGNKIVYDWRYTDIPGVGKVTFEIFDEPGGALLRVTNEGLESFPQDVPEFARDSCVAGWQYFIQGNLRDYLENQD